MAKKHNNIFLIGPMGSGKTTIGKKLANKVSKKFYDSDDEIKKNTGADIPLIFEIEGDSGFRVREKKVISELVLLDNIVLSTGGGAILDNENRSMLVENGFIIYLKSSAERIYKRTSGDKSRPLLQVSDRLGRIKEILAERESIYKSLADEIIEIDTIGINEIIKKILEIIDTYENN